MTVTMICERCTRPADGLIGGTGIDGVLCVPCCDEAGLKIPAALRQPHVGNQTNAIRDAWVQQQKEKKRAKFEEFLARKKQQEVRK